MEEKYRDDIYDKLPLLEMKIWPNDDELERFGKNIHEWAEILGHPRHSKTHNCCKTCGCATTCLYGLFFDSMVSSVLREIDNTGHLRRLSARTFNSMEEFQAAILREEIE